jgi:hypothetical protein
VGRYIDPTECTKEQFLKTYGTPISVNLFLAFEDFDGPNLPVCLVDNGLFTAAAIACDERDIRNFGRGDDVRPKKHYLVARKHLTKFL